MFFIGRGEVEIHLKTREKTLALVNTVKPGEFFGEISTLLPHINRTANATAKNFCTTASIDRSDLLVIAEIYPLFKEKLIKHALEAYNESDSWKKYIK
jgi:CRP-like cAMP-binding protein